MSSSVSLGDEEHVRRIKTIPFVTDCALTGGDLLFPAQRMGAGKGEPL